MGISCACCSDSHPTDDNGLPQQAPLFESHVSCKTPDGGTARSVHSVKQGGFSLKGFCAINPGKIEQFYRTTKDILGEGGFGCVRRGTDMRTGMVFAIKSIQKDCLDSETLDLLSEEINIMRMLDHPNIIRFQESFEDLKQIHLVLECCEGGDLLTSIEGDGYFTELSASKIIRQMLLALNYLHHNHIIHRDIKPENWLLATKGSVETAQLKLIDFGLAKRFHPRMRLSTQCGTPYYIAPEVLAGSYDERSDLWSTGVIVYLLLSGKLPFMGKNTTQVLSKVAKGVFKMSGKDWTNISDDAKAFVNALLEKDLARRPSTQDMFEYPWIVLALASRPSSCNAAKIDVANLTSYTHMHKVQKAAITVIASQLTDDKIEALKDVFMHMDSNADGTLSIKEIREGIAQTGAEMPEDIEKLILQVDSDGSGAIDYTEFLAATLDKKLYYQKDVVWRAFKRFDLDGSGEISRKELRQVLSDGEVQDALHLDDSVSELDALFDRIDTDGSGMIEFNEFFAMIRAGEEDTQNGLVSDSRMKMSAGGLAGSRSMLPSDPGCKITNHGGSMGSWEQNLRLSRQAS